MSCDDLQPLAAATMLWKSTNSRNLRDVDTNPHFSRAVALLAVVR